MPNLAGSRRSVERQMVDTCKVERRPNRYAKGTINADTGKPAEPVPELIYEGKMFLSPSGLQARTDDVAGVDASQKTYVAALPWSAPEIRPGDDLIMLTSLRDASVVGKKMTVQDVGVTTFLVYRQLTVKGLETSRG